MPIVCVSVAFMAPSNRTGRPAGFDREDALRRAVVVFWTCGYEKTSLPQLLAGMGVARSSFYAAFGSKHHVMLEALDLYTAELYAEIEGAANGEDDPGLALVAVMDAAACSKRPAHGCLFLNTVGELAPRDAEVRRRSQGHLNRVDALLRGLLSRLGHPKDAVRTKSAALLALAAGAVTLRKAGDSEQRDTEASLSGHGHRLLNFGFG